MSALAWLVVVHEAGRMNDGMDMDVRQRLTMDVGVITFSGVWVAMMVAMMFPTAAPMILVFARVQSSRRNAGRSYVPTSLFVATYLAVWTAVGLAAFGLATALGELADHHHLDADTLTRASGALIGLTGLYQLSSWKHRCLAKCRGPMHYVLGSWRDGLTGAVLMGGEHALYCAGCCWLLFVILFPIGIMNVAVMGAVTGLIVVEKVWRGGPAVARCVGVALIAVGVLTVLAPGWLPTNLDVAA